jgi:hypothetical protein
VSGHDDLSKLRVCQVKVVCEPAQFLGKMVTSCGWLVSLRRWRLDSPVLFSNRAIA